MANQTSWVKGYRASGEKDPPGKSMSQMWPSVPSHLLYFPPYLLVVQNRLWTAAH